MGLTLLRHPSVSARGICYGQSDVRLAPGHGAEIATAIEQAPETSSVIASPSIRCRGLAEALAHANGLAAPIYDPRLLELDFGDWEGKPWTQIPRIESDHWAEDPANRAPPGGERFLDLLDRVRAALRDLKNALVITHAGPIRAAWIASGQMDFDTAFATPVPHAVPIQLQSPVR